MYETYPAAGSTDQPRDTQVVVDVSSSVDPATVNEDTFRVTGSLSGAVPGTLTVDRSTLTFKPRKLYSPGETVTVQLYLKCTRSLSRDHEIRLHLRPRKGNYRHTERHDPADARLPTSRWRPGQIIVDTSELVVPPDIEPGRYAISVELVGAGGARREIGSLRVEE